MVDLTQLRAPVAGLLKGAGAVWWRHIIVYRTMAWASLCSNVAEPLLMLFAFGYGLGAIVGELAGLPYLVFILPGMMAYTSMFAASFESTVSAYARFKMQRTWDAMLATPLSLTEILLGELLWCTTKAMIAATCVFIVGALFGGVLSFGGALLAERWPCRLTDLQPAVFTHAAQHGFVAGYRFEMRFFIGQGHQVVVVQLDVPAAVGLVLGF